MKVLSKFWNQLNYGDPDALCSAITHGNKEKAEKIIRLNLVNLNQYNTFQRLPLIHAYIEGQYELMILLLEAGADPHLKEPSSEPGLYGNSLFEWCIKQREMDLFKLLLWYKPDYEQITLRDDENGATAINTWDNIESQLYKRFNVKETITATQNNYKTVNAVQAKIEQLKKLPLTEKTRLQLAEHYLTLAQSYLAEYNSIATFQAYEKPYKKTLTEAILLHFQKKSLANLQLGISQLKQGELNKQAHPQLYEKLNQQLNEIHIAPANQEHFKQIQKNLAALINDATRETVAINSAPSLKMKLE